MRGARAPNTAALPDLRLGALCPPETFTLQPPGSLLLRSPIPGGDHLAVRVGALKQAEEAVAPWESHEEENLIKLKLKRQLK